MESAYILINCQAGCEKPIVAELKQLDNVSDITSTFGPYDIVAKLEGENYETLPKVVEQIRHIEHITSTLTLPGFDENIQPEKNGDDLIPDVIPEEKKPLEPPDDIDEEDDDEEYVNKTSN